MKRLCFIFLISMLGQAHCIEITDIVLNDEYSDALSLKEDVNFYKFNLNSEGNIVVTFRHEGFSDNANIHWNVYLYNESDLEKPLNSIAIKATKRSESFSSGLGPGAYVIKVTPEYKYGNVQYWWDDPYFLTVNFEQNVFYEKSPNYSPEQATAIELNTEYSANLAPEEDVDFFKFNFPTAGKLNLSFRHSKLGDSNAYWYVYLYKETDLDLAIESIIVKGSEQSVLSEEIEVNAAGFYFIKVTPQYKYGNVQYWWDDQYFITVQTDVTQPICSNVTTYGKNPISGNWISFPTSCDVPEGWLAQNTKPEGPCPLCQTNETAAVLSPNFELHIPNIQHGGASFWADFVSISSDENILFKLTNYGQN